MSGALRRLAASSTIAGFLLLPAVTEAGKDPGAVARRYVLRQRTGEAELGTRLVLGPPVSTGARDRWTCVVFAAAEPTVARVGVLLTKSAVGWEAWFARASRGDGLDCDAMLDEARTLATDQSPYIQ